MLNAVNNVIQPHLKKKLILSVSGGVDSTVLFYLLHNLKANLVIVHFNHQQRDASILEAEYVKSLANKYDYPFEYIELSIDEDFHNQAHHLRKAHLIDIAKKHQTDVIITAHHLNDLLETILMRLSRGSNLLGYSGFVESHYKDGIYFVKPLFSVTKQAILDYASKHDIAYFVDASNKSDTYTRNRYRHHIIPALIDENPLILQKTIQYNKTLSDAFFHIRKESIRFLNEKQSFIITEFFKLDTIIQQDIIAYLLENANVSFTYQKIEHIIDFLKTGGPNTYYEVGSGYVFQKVYNKVFFQMKMAVVKVHQQLDLEMFNVLNDNTSIEFSNDLDDLDNYQVVLCYNKLALPLFVRNRQPGDVLYFQYGHKKIKDFYIDKKTPKQTRDTDLLIVDANNQILAILGKYYNDNPNNKDKIMMRFTRG